MADSTAAAALRELHHSAMAGWLLIGLVGFSTFIRLTQGEKPPLGEGAMLIYLILAGIALIKLAVPFEAVIAESLVARGVRWFGDTGEAPHG